MDIVRGPLATLWAPANRLRALAVLALLGLIVFSVDAVSRRLGGTQITGRTSTSSAGCSCHGANPNTNTTLSVTSGSGSFTVDPSSTTSFTVSVAHASQSAAGVGIAVKTSSTGTTDAGTLAVGTGSGLQTVNSEITHDAPKSFTSGVAGFTFSWTAPSTHGTYYIQAAGNAVDNSNSSTGDEWNWLSPQEVKVAGITLTSPNGGATYCSGSNVTVSWTSTAIANVKIELSADAGATWSTINASVSNPSNGSGSYTWTIPAAQAAGTQYRIRLSDAGAATRLDVSDANFTIVNTPAITAQPQSVTACASTGATLSVTATGGSLTYQWRRNGTNIPGATGASHTIASLAAGDAGTYDVQVTNACTTITSTGATVTVNAAPAITQQPQPQIACAGQPFTLSVTATGAGLTYQWRRNGADINGATSSSYTVGAASVADTGTYTVVVSGTCAPSRTSNAVRVTVSAAPAITQQPTTRMVCAGGSVSFTVAATGDGLTYQWRRNGVDIAGATGATYTINAAAAANVGTYDVVVSGTCSPAATSTGASLAVNPAPVITAQPQSLDACAGQPATLSVTAQGNGLTYQWRKDGTDLPGATAATLTIDTMELSDAGSYDVRVSIGSCSVTSSAARLEQVAPPQITGQPSDASGVAGSRIELSVNATGSALGYQWKKNDTAIDGAVAATYVIAAASPADAGDYSVVVTGACGSAVSTVARVTVLTSGSGAVLQLVPSTVDLREVRPLTAKDSVITGLIRNAGDSILRITAVNVTGANASEFEILGLNLPLTVAPGALAPLTVRFTPLSVGLRTATVNFTSNSSASASLTLRGIGSVGTLRAVSPTFDFGSVQIGTAMESGVRIENTSGVPVTIASGAVEGSATMTVTSTFPLTLAAGESRDIQVRFAPTSTDASTATLSLETNGEPATLTVALFGQGTTSASVDDAASLVESFLVAPNPSNGDVTATLRLARPAVVEAAVVDARGLVVRSLGRHEATTELRLRWDGLTDGGALAGSGAYRMVARIDGRVTSIPVVLAR